MAKIQLPPKKTEQPAAQPVDEKKIQEIVSRGGGTTKKTEKKNTLAVTKRLSVDIPTENLDMIGQLCDMRPKRPGRKIGLSKLDWILEAINEKIERDGEKYNIL